MKQPPDVRMDPATGLRLRPQALTVPAPTPPLLPAELLSKILFFSDLSGRNWAYTIVTI